MRRDEAEALSRPIPYGIAELNWIRERPTEHRTPFPVVGDDILFRLREWDTPWPAHVLQVQPEDDFDDPHLWTVEMDERGEAVIHEGRPLLRANLDPWRTVWCRIEGPGKVIVHSHAREARLRGSAGWLPLDWRSRHRPLPASLVPLLDREG